MTSKINLKKGEIQVDAIVFKEDAYYLAYIPALNLTSYSKEQDTAIHQLQDAVKLFFDYWIGNGKLHSKLIALGWNEIREDKKTKMLPSNENINIPYALLGKDYKTEPFKIPAFS